MKNTIKVFGIIALVAVIGFSLIGCDALVKEDPLSFEGTWNNQYGLGNQFVFSGNNFIYTRAFSSTRRKGTFTYSSTIITFTCTHQEENGNWVEYEEFLPGSGFGDGFSDVSQYKLTRSDTADYLSIGGLTGGSFIKYRK